MAVLSKDIQTKILTYLLSKGAKEVFLFGSQISGTANKNSDIDIGVRGLSPNIFFSVWYDIEEITNHKVDLVNFDFSTRFYDHLVKTNAIKK